VLLVPASGKRTASPSAVRASHLPRLRVQHRLPGGDGAHRADLIGAAHLLEQVAAVSAMIASIADRRPAAEVTACPPSDTIKSPSARPTAGAGVPAVTSTMPVPMLAGWPDTGTTQDTRLPGYRHRISTRPGNR